MKFSERWLRELVSPPVETTALADRLTMCGLEVESIAPAAPDFTGVVVAAVEALRPHPDADRLRICSVDAGSSGKVQIVTGAANVFDGMRVPLARVGAGLPGDKRITRSKLRGIESEGMLCSTVELGLSDKADGVLVLPHDAPIGTDIREYLDLDDSIIELNVTPNRGDCLCVLGVAREVGAEFDIDIDERTISPVNAVIDDCLDIELLAPGDCPRYAGRVIRGIDPAARTPIWLQERLRRSDLRAIHPVVDITNYVMLELGQPMHAFDLGTLDGGIRVRRAMRGEQLALLDGQGVQLDEQTLIIADHHRAVAMAGIMGGADTAVSMNTRDIFLESAFFQSAAIAGRGRVYKLQTDSAHRFERGVDSEGQVRAIERATQLILSICGGRAGRVLEQVSSEHLPGRAPIALRRARLQRVLGFRPSDNDIRKSLTRLGLGVEANEDGWNVVAPSFRPDITIEADVIEEVVRMVGYQRIPVHLPAGPIRMGNAEEGGEPRLSRARQALVQRGYREAVTYSFVDPDVDARFGSAERAIALANPISSEMAVMRTSLWTGLFQVMLHNLGRQQTRIRLFEVGRSFENADGKILQINKIAGIQTGDFWPEQWGCGSRQTDFFDTKGDVDAALVTLLGERCCDYHPLAIPALHPGQAASVTVQGREVARLGSLHPDLIAYFGLRQGVFLFEILLDSLPGAAAPNYLPLSKFPSVRRDLSLLIDAGTPAGMVQQTIREATPLYLRDLQLFDVYEGEGIDSGKKSLALGLIFQGDSSTLTDEDIDLQVAAIVKLLGARLGAVLRDS